MALVPSQGLNGQELYDEPLALNKSHRQHNKAVYRDVFVSPPANFYALLHIVVFVEKTTLPLNPK
jgi:hypothetical protein